MEMANGDGLSVDRHGTKHQPTRNIYEYIYSITILSPVGPNHLWYRHMGKHALDPICTGTELADRGLNPGSYDVIDPKQTSSGTVA